MVRKLLLRTYVIVHRVSMIGRMIYSFPIIEERPLQEGPLLYLIIVNYIRKYTVCYNLDNVNM